MADESTIETQLAKLQDALLEGRIDMATYDKLKSDLMKASAGTLYTGQPTPQPSTTTTVDHGASTAPWARGVIRLVPAGGSSSGAQRMLELHLDDELIGSGSVEEGLKAEFETPVGEHVIKLSSRLDTSSKLLKALIPAGRDVLPVHFDRPGEYRVTISEKKMSAILKDTFSELKTFSFKSNSTYDVKVEYMG